MATHGLNELLSMNGFDQADQTDAVKAAQAAHGLPIDGKPTMMLVEALRESAAPRAEARVQQPVAVVPTRQLQVSALTQAPKPPPAPGSVASLLQDDNVKTMLKLGVIAAIGVGLMAWRNSNKKKGHALRGYADVSTPDDLEAESPEEPVEGEPSGVADEVYGDADYETTNTYED